MVSGLHCSAPLCLCASVMEECRLWWTINTVDLYRLYFWKKNCISNRNTNHHSLSITSIFILGECTVSLPQHSVPRQPEKPSKCQAPAWDSTLTMPFHSRQLQHLEKEDAFSLFSLSARCSVIAFHMLPVSRPSLLYFVVSITMVCKGHKTDRPYSASGVFRFGSTSIS